MVMVDEVIKKLGSNTNLSPEVKEDLKELIIIFNNKFPNADLTNLNQRISSLKIVAGNKYEVKDIPKYDINGNSLKINTSEISKDYDGKNIMMHQLLNIISCKNVQTGDIKDVNYAAVYEGIAGTTANYLVGNVTDNHLYTDEMITVNLLSQIVDPNVLEEFYFNNNTTILVNNLIQLQNSPEEVRNFISLTKYNMVTRHLPNGVSRLGEIQKQLINMYIKKPNLSYSDMQNFKVNLYGSSNLFGEEKDKYKSIDGIYPYYEKSINNIISQETIFQGKSR